MIVGQRHRATPSGRPPAAEDGHDGTPRRELRRRRELPAGRAVVGGLLVTVAAVGAIAVARSGTGPATVPVVVAAGILDPGTPLGPDTLRVVDMALPDDVVDSTYADAEALTGTIARSHVGAGELVQRGDVVESTAGQRAAAPAREVALRLEAERAVDGRLEPGDSVDVLATYGTGTDAVTLVVLHDAAVLDARGSDDAIGSSRDVVLTLALDDRADTVALAHAVDAAALNVARTTTATDDARHLDPYRPPQAAEDAAAEGDDPR